MPVSVISHRQTPMVKLQQQHIMPFIMQQQLHMPPANMVHKFCTMLQAILSSHTQVSLKPPVHFSTLKEIDRSSMETAPKGRQAWGYA